MAALATLQDVFPGTTLSALWSVPFGTATVSGGRLSLACTAAYSAIESATSYALTSSSAFCKLTPDAGGATFECSLFLGNSAGTTGYSIGYEGGNIAALTWTGGVSTTLASATYNATSHAWVRISESGGTITYATSPDAVTWTTLTTSAETVFAVTAVFAQVFTGRTSGANGTSFADHFNVLPQHTATASLTVTPAFSASRSHASKRTAALTVTPVLAAHATGGAVPSNALLLEDGTPWLLEDGSYLLDESPGGAHTASAALTVSPVLGASSPHGNSRSASLTVTPVLSAARAHSAGAAAALTVTPAISAAGVIGFPVHNTSAALTVAPVIAAAALHKHFPSASLTVAPSFSAAALRGRFRGAALVVTPVLAAADTAAHVRSAALTVSPVIAAGRSGHHIRSAALTVSPVLAAAAVNAPGAPPGYPDSVLGERVEIAPDGTWTDITSWAIPDGSTSATIKSGQADGAQQPTPTTMPGLWINADNRFSPRNTSGPYYPNLKLNTQCRVSVNSPYGSYLRLETPGSWAQVADTSALHITGSIEVRILLQLSDWSGGILACKWDGGGSWAWTLDALGTMGFRWVDSGGTQHVVISNGVVPYQPGIMALRVFLDITTGTVTFAQAGSLSASSWTGVGTAQSGTSGAATTVAAGTGSPLKVGNSLNFTPQQIFGSIFGFRLWNGLVTAGGTLVADAGFTAQDEGSTTWTDSAGRTWALGGNSDISGRDYRLHGELASIVPTADVSSSLARTTVAVGGRFRRLQAGSAPTAQSPMKRATLQLAGALTPVAYWTMEDGAGSASFGPSIGANYMTVSGAVAKPSTDTSFEASAALPSLNGATLDGAVSSYTSSTTWVVRFLAKINTLPATGTTSGLCSIRMTGGAVAQINVEVGDSGTLRLLGLSSGGSTVFDSGYVGFGAGGKTWWYSVEATPGTSGHTQYQLAVLAPGSSSSGLLPTMPTASGAAGAVTDVQFNTLSPVLTDTVVGHVTVQRTYQDIFSLVQPLNAWRGELAGVRFARVCGEEGIQARTIGPSQVTAAMGAQPRGSVWNILKDIAWADQGLLFEPRGSFSVGFRTRASMVQQLPAVSLDFAAGNLPGNLSPADDDLNVVNDLTSSTTDGTVYRVALDDGSPMSVSDPPAGVGRYAQSTPQPFNLADASTLADVAGFYLKTRTVDGARYRQVAVNFGIPGTPAADIALLLPGDKVAVTNVPEVYQTADISQLATGSTEVLGPGRTVTWDCVPSAPYDS